MKKILALLSILVLLASMSCFAVSAKPAPAKVFVTFSDSTGKVILAQEEITVEDKNSDGKFDIDETLFAAHEAAFEGGAEAGYATATGTYGLYITKLWGDTSGNFGYYVNNAMAMGLTDEVKTGDYLDAFVYQVYEFNPVTYETTADTYCFFDSRTASLTAGETLTVVLKNVEFDANFNPVNKAVADAVITVDGKETSFKTDSEGKVTFPVDEAGEFLISAKKEGTVLVPPVLKVTAAEKEEEETAVVQATTEEKPKSDKTGDSCGALLLLIAVFGFTAVFAGKKLYEA